MKNIILTLAVLFITVSIFAQNPLEKKVGNFNEVKVFDLIKISLVKSNENKVIITGDDIGGVEVINKDGKLKVRMKIDRSFNGRMTFVAVHYKNLDIIDANEGSIIIGNELIEQDNIELRAQEGATIQVGLVTKNVNIRAVTGGIIVTRGKSQFQEVVLNTGGIYEGREFETKDTNVTIRAAGEAEIKASGIVNVKIRAGGDVIIYGDPETVNENKIFGGRIERRN